MGKLGSLLLDEETKQNIFSDIRSMIRASAPRLDKLNVTLRSKLLESSLYRPTSETF